MARPHRLQAEDCFFHMRKLAGLDNRKIGGVLGMNSLAASNAAISIERGIDASSQLRSKAKRLFSIFEG